MATPSSTSFMCLPPEVRICIYKYLLVAPKDGCIRAIAHRARSGSYKISGVPPLCGTPKVCLWCINGKEHQVCASEYPSYSYHYADRTLMGRSGGRIHPSILSVSKVVYNEAMPLLYSNLQLSIYITGHNDVHDILKSLPKFPCNIEQIAFNICPEMIITSSEKEIILDAINILDIVLNQYKPAIIASTVYVGAGNNEKICHGLLHEILCRCGLMRTKEPVAVMSEARRASLYRNMKRDVQASRKISATLNKFHSRQHKKRKDYVPNWLEESQSLRQNI